MALNYIACVANLWAGIYCTYVGFKYKMAMSTVMGGINLICFFGNLYYILNNGGY